MNDLGQIIQQKEKELREIHELRCSQLETLVHERDQILIESSRRFEQLKEDFKYNLRLIEARDEEILKLESTVASKTRKVEDSEGRRRELQIRLEESEAKEKEAQQALLNHKMTSKDSFDRVSNEWDAKFSHNENEIIRLKAALVEAHRECEICLERQEKELHSFYEDIINQREAERDRKANEISTEIKEFTERLHSLQNENMKLTIEGNELRKSEEKLKLELLEKEEQKRKLLHAIEDMRHESIRKEDALLTQKQHIETEVIRIKAAHEREISELQAKIEKLQLDIKAEKTHIASLQKTMEELTINNKEKLTHYENELIAYHALELNLTEELHQYRDALQQQKHITDTHKIQLETEELKTRNLISEQDTLKRENETLKQSLTTVQQKLESEIQRSLQLERAYKEKEEFMMQHSSEQMILKTHMIDEELHQLQRKHYEEIEQLKHDQSEVMAAKDMELRRLQEENKELKEKIASNLEKSLKESREMTEELNALRLRNEARQRAVYGGGTAAAAAAGNVPRYPDGGAAAASSLPYSIRGNYVSGAGNGGVADSMGSISLPHNDTLLSVAADRSYDGYGSGGVNADYLTGGMHAAAAAAGAAGGAMRHDRDNYNYNNTARGSQQLNISIASPNNSIDDLMLPTVSPVPSILTPNGHNGNGNNGASSFPYPWGGGGGVTAGLASPTRYQQRPQRQLHSIIEQDHEDVSNSDVNSQQTRQFQAMKLQTENEQLKQLVKQMKMDMESLKHQYTPHREPLPPHPPPLPAAVPSASQHAPARHERGSTAPVISGSRKKERQTGQQSEKESWAEQQLREMQERHAREQREHRRVVEQLMETTNELRYELKQRNGNNRRGVGGYGSDDIEEEDGHHHHRSHLLDRAPAAATRDHRPVRRANDGNEVDDLFRWIRESGKQRQQQQQQPYSSAPPTLESTRGGRGASSSARQQQPQYFPPHRDDNVDNIRGSERHHKRQSHSADEYDYHPYQQRQQQQQQDSPSELDMPTTLSPDLHPRSPPRPTATAALPHHHHIPQQHTQHQQEDADATALDVTAEDITLSGTLAKNNLQVQGSHPPRSSGRQSSAAIGTAVNNSNRATVSQQQALKRIKEHRLKAELAPKGRVAVNYAKFKEESTDWLMKL